MVSIYRILGENINSLIIMTTLFYKIPPNLPLTKRGIIPSLEKRGKGRFSDKCQFNYETLDKYKALFFEG
jgi:hypothetical protein